eukprot:scaffold241613_cov39-Tisochrysis_lutea.AAC.1
MGQSAEPRPARGGCLVGRARAVRRQARARVHREIAARAGSTRQEAVAESPRSSFALSSLSLLFFCL